MGVGCPEHFRLFHQILQVISGMMPYMNHDSDLVHLYQFNIQNPK
jgi:hypothetical protein